MSAIAEYAKRMNPNQVEALLDEVKHTKRRQEMEFSLAEFTKAAWEQLEPGRQLRWNWHLDVICAYLEAVHRGRIRRLIINVPFGTMKSLLVSVFYPAWVWTHEPSHRWLCGSNEGTLATRDALKMRTLVTSDWYQSYWPIQMDKNQQEKTLFANASIGHRESQGILAKISGKRGDTIIWDDPHDTKQAESDVQRQSILDSWDFAWSSRMNDPITSSAIVIMQRVHYLDITAHLQNKTDQHWVTLAIPMRYEVGEDAVRYDAGADIGRPDLNDPRTFEGELMFPDRFDEQTVKDYEQDLGPYGCTPHESPVLMADLSYKRIGEIAKGEKVIGFTTPIPGETRSRLVQATVRRKFKYSAMVYRITLDSGEVIRCTEDHKWFRRFRGSERPSYLPINVGSDLIRVSNLQDTDPPDDSRLAGWLAGFFDGEGSCTHHSRPSGAATSQVSFYQGAGRNRPLCDKLEHALDHFGFRWSYVKDERKDPRAGVNFEYRQYRLIGSDLPMFQRFLHQIQPIKWRDRMISGALTAKWAIGKEKVVSMEPDGVEPVYALETDTGNYVVWGFASSNSAGQLQQRPSPKGGGEFQRSWLCYYKNRPRRTNNIIIVDPAGERKQGATASEMQLRDRVAMGVLGLGEDGNWYVLDAYWDRLNLTERTEILFKWHREYRPKMVGYEQYGMQSDIAHIREKMEDVDYRFAVTELGGSLNKKDRIRRLVPLFAARRIWLPETLYRTDASGKMIDVINNVIEEEYLPFPVGAHDDFMDMLSRIQDEDIKSGMQAPMEQKPMRVRRHRVTDRGVGR